MVMVEKPNGSQRICADYKSLNKICRKQPLMCKDLLTIRFYQWTQISHIYGCLFRFSLDTNVSMIIIIHHLPNKALIVISDATQIEEWQCHNPRLITKCFKKKIGKNTKVQVASIIVKSPTSNQHLMDLKDTFDI